MPGRWQYEVHDSLTVSFTRRTDYSSALVPLRGSQADDRAITLETVPGWLDGKETVSCSWLTQKFLCLCAKTGMLGVGSTRSYFSML